VVNILQQTVTNPHFNNDLPRQPPPSYGAARVAPKQREATFPFPFSPPVALKPQPTPVPTLQPATQATATPVLPAAPPAKAPRSRSRVVAPRGKGRAKKDDMEDTEEVPVLSTRASSRAPSKPPVADTPMPSARKRAAAQEAERVPVVKATPRQARPASVGERVPVIRAKARPRKPTTPIEPETPQPPKRSRSRAARSQSTEVVLVQMNISRGASRSRPPRSASDTPVLVDAVRTTARELGEDVAVIPMVRPLKSVLKAPKTARTQRVPAGQKDKPEYELKEVAHSQSLHLTNLRQAARLRDLGFRKTKICDSHPKEDCKVGRKTNLIRCSQK